MKMCSIVSRVYATRLLNQLHSPKVMQVVAGTRTRPQSLRNPCRRPSEVTSEAERTAQTLRPRTQPVGGT